MRAIFSPTLEIIPAIYARRNAFESDFKGCVEERENFSQITISLVFVKKMLDTAQMVGYNEVVDHF